MRRPSLPQHPFRGTVSAVSAVSHTPTSIAFRAPLPRILKAEIGDVQRLGDPSHQNSGGQRVTLNLRSRLIRQIGQLLEEAVTDELDVH